MKERPRRLRVQHMDNQAPVLSYSAIKSIECASPRPSYRNEPASLAIDPFPQRGSVPTFQSGCLTPQLYRSHHKQSISRRSFFVRGMFSLSGDWYSTPRFGGPFSGKVYFADRVSMMAGKRKPDHWLLPLVDAPSSERFVPLRVQSTSAHVILALNITFFGKNLNPRQFASVDR